MSEATTKIKSALGPGCKDLSDADLPRRVAELDEYCDHLEADVRRLEHELDCSERQRMELISANAANYHLAEKCRREHGSE